MSSLSLRCGVSHPSIHRSRRLGVDWPNSKPNQIAPLRRSSSRRIPQIAAALTTAAAADPPVSNNNRSLYSENLHEWMRDSAVEIVKNLRDAPLLVQVYANNNGEARRLETEKAVAEDWPVITRRWKDGETPSPDGVILVEELGCEGETETGDRSWGIVVQGKGAECGPACYLMKTNRVCSGMGSGCTHFCLVRVKGFRESALSQLTNSWLLE